MAPIRVGLMGIGRVGRNLFRILYKDSDIRIVAIDEIADHSTIEYLIRFDTILGPFPDELAIKEGHLYVAGRQIPMMSHEDPGDVPWGDLGVDIVIEAAGRERTRRELEQHLENGARRVILCAPPKDPPDLTVVMGVNDEQLAAEHRIVSNASCTAHCAAPIVKILNDAFGIERALPQYGARLLEPAASGRRAVRGSAAWPRGCREHHSPGDQCGPDGQGVDPRTRRQDFGQGYQRAGPERIGGRPRLLA